MTGGQQKKRSKSQQRVRRERQEQARKGQHAQRYKPTFAPTVADDVLLAVTIAALVAGMGVSTLAVWVNGGWGGAIGFFAVFGLVGIGAMVVVLQNKQKQRAALWWLTAIGVGVALASGLWLLA